MNSLVNNTPYKSQIPSCVQFRGKFCMNTGFRQHTYVPRLRKNVIPWNIKLMFTKNLDIKNCHCVIYWFDRSISYWHKTFHQTCQSIMLPGEQYCLQLCSGTRKQTVFYTSSSVSKHGYTSCGVLTPGIWECNENLSSTRHRKTYNNRYHTFSKSGE